MNRYLSRTILVALLCVGTAAAAGAQVAAPPAQDPSQVKMVTTKLADNLYAIDGMGGRTGVLVGPDGTFVIDSQFAQVSDKLLAAIKEISPGPLKILVNTHVHPDHTGGNEALAKAGATIIARPQLRNRLARPPAGPNGQPGTPAPAGALPVLVYDSRTTVFMNGEQIQLIPLPAAHTDTDTGVYFPKANVFYTGDVFRSTGYPNMDRANGGSLNGTLTGLELIITNSDDNTKIVPGHGDITNRKAVQEFYGMIAVIRDRVDKAMAQEKTMQEIIASKPTKDFDARFGANADRFVQQLYEELASR